jgi:asparagine N-glycosylation enzyme membrane subunit Stt3
VAKRRVIFDGQTQHIPQAYWMAKVFLTDSEKKAIAILRMLDNGANQAFELINREISDPFQAVKLLEKALETDKKSAKELLRKS